MSIAQLSHNLSQSRTKIHPTCFIVDMKQNYILKKYTSKTFYVCKNMYIYPYISTRVMLEAWVSIFQ